MRNVTDFIKIKFVSDGNSKELTYFPTYTFDNFNTYVHLFLSEFEKNYELTRFSDRLSYYFIKKK